MIYIYLRFYKVKVILKKKSFLENNNNKKESLNHRDMDKKKKSKFLCIEYKINERAEKKKCQEPRNL